MATHEEQIDELIELAKDLADAEIDLAQNKRDAEQYRAQSHRGRMARKFIPHDKRRVESCTARLNAARERLLAQWPTPVDNTTRAPDDDRRV